MKENFPIKVKKKSGKPFKSGKKINTAIGIVINEDDPKERQGYIFEEDNSVVNIEQCEVVKFFKYIPGDFVEYKGKICEVVMSRDNDSYSIEESLNCYLGNLDLTPIRLTCDILEKNGWTRSEHHVDEDNFEWYVYANSKVEEIVIQYYPKDEFSVFYYGDSEMQQINYVHELQHLLFGLDIDYKIKLC